LLAEGKYMTSTEQTPPLTPTSTAPVEDLVRALYRLGLVQRELARHALTELGSQGFTALAVIHTEGPVRVSDVAARLGVDLSVASRQVAALVAAGHVTRTSDAGDARVRLLATTARGRTVLEDSHRRMVDTVAHALTGWQPGDVAALAERLDLLREDFGTAARTAT
jgi:DNA-binding MarR family transcriptional regulator